MDPTSGVFTHPFQYWVGMDTDPRTTPDALEQFNRFYSTVHVHEVIDAHPGFVSVSRYELLDPDPREAAAVSQHHGPRWLAVYEMRDQAAADQYLKDNARPWLHRRAYSPWPPARKRAKTVWRLLWRQIHASGPAAAPPTSVYLVGTTVPPETDAAGLAAFTTFYDRTHIPEIMSADGYSRATRYELVRDFGHPEPGCPRFCAVYETDAPATADRAARRTARGPVSSGPPAWENRHTAWRLVYRRLADPD